MFGDTVTKTWTVSCSHFADIIMPPPGFGQGQNEGPEILQDFDFVVVGSIHVSQTDLVYILLPPKYSVVRLTPYKCPSPITLTVSVFG